MVNEVNALNDPDAEPNNIAPDTGRNSDASFIGWQGSLKDELFAVYNVTAPLHPLFGSTVSEKTLRLNNLSVPKTPLPPKPPKKF